MIKMKLFEDKIGSRLNLFFQHGTNVSINDPRNLALYCESKMCTTAIAISEGHDYIIYMSAMNLTFHKLILLYKQEVNSIRFNLV